MNFSLGDLQFTPNPRRYWVYPDKKNMYIFSVNAVFRGFDRLFSRFQTSFHADFFPFSTRSLLFNELARRYLGRSRR